MVDFTHARERARAADLDSVDPARNVKRARVTDEWLLQQQQMAASDAAVWRRLRAAGAHPNLAPAGAEPALIGEHPLPISQHAAVRIGSVQSLLAQGLLVMAAVALAFSATLFVGGGDFEAWLAGVTGMAVTLSLLLLWQAKPLRERMFAAAGWALVIGVALGGGRMLQDTGPAAATQSAFIDRGYELP